MKKDIPPSWLLVIGKQLELEYYDEFLLCKSSSCSNQKFPQEYGSKDSVMMLGLLVILNDY